MKERKRRAEVFSQGGRFIILPIDVNTVGHGIERPEPVVLEGDVATPSRIGHEVARALASVRGGLPTLPWDDHSQPTFWHVLGYKSEAAFTRSARLVLVRQDEDMVSALANRRQGRNFLVADHPGFPAPLNDAEAIGGAVLQAMEMST